MKLVDNKYDITNINAFGVWGLKVGVQISRRKLHTHIYFILD